MTPAEKNRAERWKRAYALVDMFRDNIYENRDRVACHAYRALEAEWRRARKPQRKRKR